MQSIEHYRSVTISRETMGAFEKREERRDISKNIAAEYYYYDQDNQ